MKLQYSQNTENKLKLCPESMHRPPKVSEKKLQFQLQINMAS